MEGRPWLFRRQLIIFDRLKEATERRNIKLVFSLFWLKIGHCPLECEKKDFMHAIGFYFWRSNATRDKKQCLPFESSVGCPKTATNGNFYYNWQSRESMASFKYENLPNVCFGCSHMGHAVKDCTKISISGEEKLEDDFSYSLALKAEFTSVGKECLQFSFSIKKIYDTMLIY